MRNQVSEHLNERVYNNFLNNTYTYLRIKNKRKEKKEGRDRRDRPRKN